LRSLALRYGGQADIVDAVANRAMRLLTVPADDAVADGARRRCGAAVSPFGAIRAARVCRMVLLR
jgi:hypothetical protein